MEVPLQIPESQYMLIVRELIESAERQSAYRALLSELGVSDSQLSRAESSAGAAFRRNPVLSESREFLRPEEITRLILTLRNSVERPRQRAGIR